TATRRYATPCTLGPAGKPCRYRHGGRQGGLNGVEAWVETKLRRGNRVKFLATQPAWLVKGAIAGSRVYILARKEDTFNLWHGRQVREHKSVALRPGGWLGLMAEAYSRSRKANWLGKKNLESRVRGIFQRDDAPGIGAVQMTSERVARGAGPVQLLVGAHRGANRKRHFSVAIGL